VVGIHRQAVAAMAVGAVDQDATDAHVAAHLAERDFWGRAASIISIPLCSYWGRSVPCITVEARPICRHPHQMIHMQPPERREVVRETINTEVNAVDVREMVGIRRKFSRSRRRCANGGGHLIALVARQPKPILTCG
jgi:hypothetical protein